MAIHTTNTGYVELLGQWGHGRASARDYSAMPAVITDDDGDGHYSAWRVRGSMRDAAETLGQFLLRNDGRYVAEFTGREVRAVSTPGDFWTIDEDTGGAMPNLAAHPDVVAW